MSLPVLFMYQVFGDITEFKFIFFNNAGNIIARCLFL